MSLTGTALVVILICLAVAGPVALAVTWRRLPPRWFRARWLGPRWVGILLRGTAILMCQVVAVLAVGVGINDQFGFYASWSDLLGRPGQVDTSPVVPAGQLPSTKVNGQTVYPEGRLISVRVHGHVSGVTAPVLVWLPPQYSMPAFAHHSFPLLTVLPGAPGNPGRLFTNLGFAQTASDAIDNGTVKPFVAIFPPITIRPPWDTECTDVPRGPQAESWLSVDLREGLMHKLRFTGRWGVMGYSTGGFCAAKLVLHVPTAFAAGVSVAGYYSPITDGTIGDLFHGSKALRDLNSPIWLIQHNPPRPSNLLIVTSRQDRESWPSSDQMIKASAKAGVPGVSDIITATGGHNYGAWDASLPASLAWLGRTMGL